MGFFSRFRKQETKMDNSNNERTFTVEYKGSSPIVKIGRNDITKPYIYTSTFQQESYVHFGADNLYPQLIDQMYYQSTLHSSIIKFQTIAAIRSGYEFIKKNKSGINEVNEREFVLKTKLPKLLGAIALDLKMHQRVHFLCKRKDGKIISIERILPSKVRYNNDRSKFWVSYDWSTSQDVRVYNSYDSPNLTPNEYVVYSYTNIEMSPGQDVYPLPSEISSFNWVYLDGQSSTLQKQNIQRTIFGNLVIKVPEELENDEHIQFIKQFMNKEGEISPIILLSANGKENIPEIDSFPVGDNDKQFENLYTRIDNKICQAHSISPVIMGIQTPGALGSGSDIRESYPIWVKHTLRPFQDNIEEIVNNLTVLLNYNIGEFKLNDYPLVDLLLDNNNNQFELIKKK